MLGRGIGGCKTASETRCLGTAAYPSSSGPAVLRDGGCRIVVWAPAPRAGAPQARWTPAHPVPAVLVFGRSLAFAVGRQRHTRAPERSSGARGYGRFVAGWVGRAADPRRHGGRLEGRPPPACLDSLLCTGERQHSRKVIVAPTAPVSPASGMGGRFARWLGSPLPRHTVVSIAPRVSSVHHSRALHSFRAA